MTPKRNFKKDVILLICACIILGLFIFISEIAMVGPEKSSETIFTFTGGIYRDITINWQKMGRYPTNISDATYTSKISKSKSQSPKA
jgi:hypothetical protein